MMKKYGEVPTYWTLEKQHISWILDIIHLTRAFEIWIWVEVGVLTKFDLDENGDAVPALLGDVYPLRLGYTAVVCRRVVLS